MKLKDFKIGDWIFDNRCELKQIVEIDDGIYRYSDGNIVTSASEDTNCWILNRRNLVLANFLKTRINKLQELNAFTNRAVRETFYNFVERLFELPYGRDNISETEKDICYNFYCEVDNYTNTLIEAFRNSGLGYVKPVGC